MLQDFFTSALIIDNDFKEVKDLISYLEEDKDVWTKYLSPADLDKKTTPFNNRKIIFLDLYLDDSRSSIDNISKIRSYFKSIIGKNFGTYGIVLWTKHTSHFDDFCTKIFQKNNPFTLPLFVIPLDKTIYIRKGNYEGVLEDLEIKLTTDVPSSFFIEWNKAVINGSDKTISSLYNLFDTNEKKNNNLEAVLYELACNYTGIPKDNINDYDLQKDLVKSLMDSLQFEISGNYKKIQGLFSDPASLEYSDTDKEKVFSKLNYLLLLDSDNLSESYVFPGNIYEILSKDTLLYIDEVFYRKNGKIKKIDLNNNENDIKVNKRIAIEITPPCDFAQNKKQSLSRIVGGVILDYNEKVKEYFKGNSLYTDLYPVYIEEFENPQILIFDFYRLQTVKEDDLKDTTKYKIFVKAKDKLFSDILQKLSSHIARLGIAVIN